MVLAQSVIFKIWPPAPPGGGNWKIFFCKLTGRPKLVDSLVTTFLIGAIFVDLKWGLSWARMAPILTPGRFWVPHKAPLGPKTKVDSP